MLVFTRDLNILQKKHEHQFVLTCEAPIFADGPWAVRTWTCRKVEQRLIWNGRIQGSWLILPEEQLRGKTLIPQVTMICHIKDGEEDIFKVRCTNVKEAANYFHAHSHRPAGVWLLPAAGAQPVGLHLSTTAPQLSQSWVFFLFTNTSNPV